FVEIGGYDGENFSNTLFLEKVRNWDGLLVEASPFLYDMMLTKDRKCYMVNACISKSLPAMTFVLAGAITSAKETLTDRHSKRIDRGKITYAKDEHWAHANDTVKVNCFSFRKLMRTVGRNYIDYFSLDVEGAEMHILNSIEWEDLNIDVFMIETDQHRDQIMSLMKQKGYKWIHKLSGDDIFQKIRDGVLIALWYRGSCSHVTTLEDLLAHVTTLTNLPAHITTLEDLPAHVTTLEDLLAHVTTLEDLLAHVTTLEDLLAHVTTLEDLLAHVTTLGDLLAHVTTLEDLIAHVTTLEDLLAHVTTLVDLLDHVTTPADLLVHITTLDDLLAHVTTLEDLLAHVTVN
ncbi:uncharacterized protein LOC127706746, partial [Mytilus californianus]|uniref:uncharacterized protein LOC127706746 n=1 Tax=Mytilus californianus TaxID=6549 RepID=UPI00224761E3